ncbi:hypothetical protein BGZ54_010099, partial [Gamsiella multidivaricata]
MSKTESFLIDLAFNGQSDYDANPSLHSTSTRRSPSSHGGLPHLQMAQLQAPRFDEATFDPEARSAAPSKDLFESMEPHLRLNHTKNTAPTRSKL